MPPMVSVVLPTHNRPVWLERSLRSVLDGAFEDFEVIVSNNGDPDHTRELATRIRDPRVRWVEAERDSTVAEHMVAALRLADGEFVSTVCDDDWWEPSFLADLVPALQARDDAVVAFCDHFIVDEDGVKDMAETDSVTAQFGRSGLKEGYYEPFFEFAARQSVTYSGAVFRRSRMGIDELTASIGEFLDVWIVYRLASGGGAAYYCPERLLNYTRHGSSITGTRDISTYRSAIRYREQMLQDPRMSPHGGILREKLSRDHLSAGAALMRLKARKEAREHLCTALKLHPSVKAVGGIVATLIAPSFVLEKV